MDVVRDQYFNLDIMSDNFTFVLKGLVRPSNSLLSRGAGTDVGTGSGAAAAASRQSLHTDEIRDDRLHRRDAGECHSSLSSS